MENTFDIDPITKKELFNAIEKGFSELLQTMESDSTEYFMMDWRDLVKLCYSIGFIHGCIVPSTDETLKETVFVMNEEIRMQRGKK